MGDKNIHLSASLGIGKKPKDGMDGKDAINIVFSPAELVFDADENGNLKQAEKSAEIKVYRGTTELQYKTDWDNDAEIGDNCSATLLVNTTTNKPEVKISGITSSNIDDVKVPATSGGANVSVIVDSVKYRAYLPFSVNVNTYANFLIRDNKKYINKYTEISNKYDDVSAELNKKADLKTVESTIEQTAANIKLEVLSKTSGRRNMLPNSAFLNQDSVFIHPSARIEINSGLDGVNCIHSSDKYSGTGDGNYIGAFWDSTQRNGVVTNIPIIKGKKYVISCWIKSDNLELPFHIECLYMKSINQQSRADAKGAKNEVFKVTEKNKWQKISCVLDTDNADATEYLAVNFWSNTKIVPKADGATEYPTCNAYICKPMMEEGDTYGGWTLSEDDYDYVGGNMIDNARTLEVGGSLKSFNASNVPDYGRSYYGDSMSLRINNTNADSTPSIMTFKPSLEVGVDYMFSFLAKGTANIGLYALCDNSVDGDYLLSEDSVNADVRIIDTFKNRYALIILIPQLTTEYKRYWGHMRFYGHVPTELYLQLNHAGEVYICQPKLEVGANMTEFTERKTDLVDKASLKKAGIEITTNQVKLYGDKVQVLTRKDESSEYVEAGMFVNGKLNANLIDAETINVNHVYARSSEGANIIGHFGNFDKADAIVGNEKCPLWLGAELAKNAPFRVTSLGDLYSNSGKIGPFWISPPAFRDCLVSGTFTADPDVTKYTSCIKLSKTLIDVVGKDDSTSGDIAGATSMRRVRIGTETKIDGYINPLYVKAWIEGHSSMGTTGTAGIIVDSQDSLGVGRAFWARFGSYAGFRRAIYEASEGFNAAYVCCEGYGLVVMNNTQQVTITCPADYDGLEEGSELVIIRNNANLYFSGKVIQTGNGHANITATAKYEIIHLYYLGSKGWYLNFESNY
jgi:hypothetical protein